MLPSDQQDTKAVESTGMSIPMDIPTTDGFMIRIGLTEEEAVMFGIVHED